MMRMTGTRDLGIVGRNACRGSRVFQSNTCANDCVRSEEAEAFTLRHLQTRLMVAALSCNQLCAMRTIVLSNISSRSWPRAAINSPPTSSAWVADRIRIESSTSPRSRTPPGSAVPPIPQGFCSKTWELFFDLEQAPEKLLSLAEANLMSAIGQPQACETKPPAVASTETAAPQEAETAVK